MSAHAEDYLALDDARLLAQCEVHAYRASGPGGQKRNKTSSAVRLHHGPTALISKATESRSQHENKARALRRLRLTIALKVRGPYAPESDSPSELLRECITPDGRLQCGRRDARYPALVRDLLDAFVAYRGSTAETAAAVGITTSHLVLFLRKDPKLWARANEIRADYGVPPLR